MTSGAFNLVPSNLRVPGVYAEVDPSLAGLSSSVEPVLIMGQKLASGTQPAGEVVFIPGDHGDAASELFGAGSQLHEMIVEFRRGNKTSTLYAVAADDAGGSAKASLTRTFSGTATKAGVFVFYLGGGSAERLASVGVAVGDTAVAVATAAAAAINAKANIPVSAAAAAGVLTITYDHGGLTGNDYRVEINRRGVFEGERLPEGIAIAEVDDGYMSGGLIDPDVTPLIAGIGDEVFDYICFPWTGDATLDAMRDEGARRWHPITALWSLFFSARRGSPNELLSFSAQRNNPYLSVMETFGASAPAYVRAARYVAVASRALENHPARPLQDLELVGEEAPAKALRMGFSDRNTLLYSGIATSKASPQGTVLVERGVTTYQKNTYGQPDSAFLDINTPAQIRRINRQLGFLVYQKFISRRVILVDDGTPIAEGIPSTSPRKIKATLVAHYDELMLQGLVENKDAFERLLIVSRDPQDPQRINIRYAPDLTNGLMVGAIQVGFSLQWDESSLLAA